MDSQVILEEILIKTIGKVPITTSYSDIDQTCAIK